MVRTPRPVIGFLSDFGLDGAAATCRGVILAICPEAQIVDVCHTVRKYAVADGAYLLRATLPFLPVGVHLAVVDPGVGTVRMPIALQTERGDLMVGPDNGLLVPAAEALGGAVSARLLADRRLWRPTTTPTFHGRDLFAPVAAHLAVRHARYEEVGPEIALETLVRLPERAAHAEAGALETVVTYVDSFGNLRLAGGMAELRAAFGDLGDGQRVVVEFRPDGREPIRDVVRYATTFGAVAVGASLLYIDSLGELAVADNQGNAAGRLRVDAGHAVRMTLGS